MKLPNRSTPVNHALPGAGLQVGIVGSPDLRCGVAEYSRYLRDGFTALGAKCVLVGPGHQAAGQLAGALGHGNCTAVSIQYHPGLYDPCLLVGMARSLSASGIKLSVTLHHTGLLDQARLHALAALGAHFIVHSPGSVSLLRSLGVSKAAWLAQGVLTVCDEPREMAQVRLGLAPGPVVGICGFLRPHKGLAQLIEAMPLVVEEFSDATLLILQPLHPSRESVEHFELCRRLIIQHRLQDRVMLELDFLEAQELIRCLHACDVIVLPYGDSAEGASGAARSAIAARRPLITSDSGIFADLDGVAYKCASRQASRLASAICKVLSDAPLASALREASCRYANENSWEQTALRMLESFAGRQPDRRE